MINFYFQKWYLNALEHEDINVNTNWEWFGNEFIPNLPLWIKKNKPKKILHTTKMAISNSSLSDKPKE